MPLRTASEFIKKDMLLFDLSESVRIRIEAAINEARKEAIEECAERSRYLKLPDGNFKYLKENGKDSVLLLIKELK